jgi:hypothetical protein
MAVVIDPAYVYYGPWVDFYRDNPKCDHGLQHSYEPGKDGLKFCFRCGMKAELPYEEASVYRLLMGYTAHVRRVLGLPDAGTRRST